MKVATFIGMAILISVSQSLSQSRELELYKEVGFTDQKVIHFIGRVEYSQRDRSGVKSRMC